MWAAEPHLEARKRIGFQVMIFLIVFAGLLYFTKKKVWRDGRRARVRCRHRKVAIDIVDHGWRFDRRKS